MYKLQSKMNKNIEEETNDALNLFCSKLNEQFIVCIKYFCFLRIRNKSFRFRG